MKTGSYKLNLLTVIKLLHNTNQTIVHCKQKAMNLDLIGLDRGCQAVWQYIYVHSHLVGFLSPAKDVEKQLPRTTCSGRQRMGWISWGGVS